MSETFKVGDTVRIVRAMSNSAEGRASLGKVGVLRHAGTVGQIGTLGLLTSYAVDVDGVLHFAAQVEPAPSPSEPELVLDRRRVAAAREASAILGENADETEIEMLGEWLLNERPVAPAKPVREPIDDQTFTGWYERLGAQPARYLFTTNSNDPDPTSKPDADETARELETAKATVRDDLTIKDLDVGFDDSYDNDVVQISTDGSEYLEEREVDRLIEFLQAAKVVHAARRAENNDDI